MRSKEWSRYVAHIIGTDDQTTVGERVGVSQPTVGRWLKGTIPDPGTVAELARVYGRSAPEAFVAAGMLTADEVGRSLTKKSRDLLASLFLGDELPPIDTSRENRPRREA